MLTVYSDEAESGTVISQQPAGGTRVERAAQVDLFLAGGSSETWIMPDLVKLSYDNVRRFFEARGFRIGRVSYEIYAAGTTPGTVLRQFPQPGHPLHRGDVIALTLAAAEPGSGTPDEGDADAAAPETAEGGP
jgi:serine/threonine-protein kinase